MAAAPSSRANRQLARASPTHSRLYRPAISPGEAPVASKTAGVPDHGNVAKLRAVRAAALVGRAVAAAGEERTAKLDDVLHASGDE